MWHGVYRPYWPCTSDKLLTNVICVMHLDLLLDEEALDQLTVSLPQPGMVHAYPELQGVPQV